MLYSTGAQGTIERRSRWDDPLTAEFRLNPWLAGGLMGLGYCLGELPNSFVKRRLDIAPGMRRGPVGMQYLIDQMDLAAGCLLMLRLFSRPRRGEIRASALLGTAIHVGVDCLLYIVGVKRFK